MGTVSVAFLPRTVPGMYLLGGISHIGDAHYHVDKTPLSSPFLRCSASWSTTVCCTRGHRLRPPRLPLVWLTLVHKFPPTRIIAVLKIPAAYRCPTLDNLLWMLPPSRQPSLLCIISTHATLGTTALPTDRPLGVTTTVYFKRCSNEGVLLN